MSITLSGAVVGARVRKWDAFNDVAPGWALDVFLTSGDELMVASLPSKICEAEAISPADFTAGEVVTFKVTGNKSPVKVPRYGVEAAG